MKILNYYFNVSVLLLIFVFVTVNLFAQVSDKDSKLPVKEESAVLSSDQPFASYWFPLEILSWSPAADPDAPYNRSAVELKNKFVDSVTIVNPNARFNEATVNPLSAFAPTSNNPSQGLTRY